jgi:hypothetical protein
MIKEINLQKNNINFYLNFLLAVSYSIINSSFPSIHQITTKMKKKPILLFSMLFFVIVCTSQTNRAAADPAISCVSFSQWWPYTMTDIRCDDCTIVAGKAHGEECRGSQH